MTVFGIDRGSNFVLHLQIMCSWFDDVKYVTVINKFLSFLSLILYPFILPELLPPCHQANAQLLSKHLLYAENGSRLTPDFEW